MQNVLFKGNFVFECTLNFKGGPNRPAIVKLFIRDPKDKWRYQDSLKREYHIYKCVVSNFDKLPFFACPYFCTERDEIPVQFHTLMKKFVGGLQVPFVYEITIDNILEKTLLATDVVQVQKCFVMCTENCKGPTLHDYLYGCDKEEFPVRWAQTFVQLYAAVQCMVKNALVHNDLHFYNIKVVTEPEFYFNCETNQVVQDFEENHCLKLTDTVKIFDWDSSYVEGLDDIDISEKYRVQSNKKSMISVYDKLALIRFITVAAKETNKFLGLFDHFPTFDEKFKEIFSERSETLCRYGGFEQMTDLTQDECNPASYKSFEREVNEFMDYLREGAIKICKANKPQASA